MAEMKSFLIQESPDPLLSGYFRGKVPQAPLEAPEDGYLSLFVTAISFEVLVEALFGALFPAFSRGSRP